MTMQRDYKAERPARRGRKYFTLEEANRALPYVSRVLDDVRATYRRAVELQQRLDRPMPDEGEAAVAQAEYERSVESLNRFVDELSEVGVELKDYQIGLVDFPAMRGGREVCLCWRSGEAEIAAWHEVDAGFAGRKDIALLGELD